MAGGAAVASHGIGGTSLVAPARASVLGLRISRGAADRAGKRQRGVDAPQPACAEAPERRQRAVALAANFGVGGKDLVGRVAGDRGERQGTDLAVDLGAADRCPEVMAWGICKERTLSSAFEDATPGLATAGFRGHGRELTAGSAIFSRLP
jgi:hypothetical protein